MRSPTPLDHTLHGQIVPSSLMCSLYVTLSFLFAPRAKANLCAQRGTDTDLEVKMACPVNKVSPLVLVVRQREPLRLTSALFIGLQVRFDGSTGSRFAWHLPVLIRQRNQIHPQCRRSRSSPASITQTPILHFPLRSIHLPSLPNKYKFALRITLPNDQHLPEDVVPHAILFVNSRLHFVIGPAPVRWLSNECPEGTDPLPKQMLLVRTSQAKSYSSNHAANPASSRDRIVIPLNMVRRALIFAFRYTAFGNFSSLRNASRLQPSP